MMDKPDAFCVVECMPLLVIDENSDFSCEFRAGTGNRLLAAHSSRQFPKNSQHQYQWMKNMAILKTKKKNGSRSPKSSGARRRRLTQKQAHLNFEPLEDRRLMAVDLSNPGDREVRWMQVSW